jgi:hypothetical protein
MKSARTRVWSAGRTRQRPWKVEAMLWNAAYVGKVILNCWLLDRSVGSHPMHCLVVRWLMMMTWKWFGRHRSWPTRSAIPPFVWRTSLILQNSQSGYMMIRPRFKLSTPKIKVYSVASTSSSLARQPFWPIAFLKSLRQTAPVFTSLDFVTNLFTEQGPTPNLEDQVFIFTFPSDGVAQLYPQALGSLFYRFLRLAGLRWSHPNQLPHGEVKVITMFNLVQRHEDTRGRGSTRWRSSGQLNVQAGLPLAKEPQYPLGGSQSWWKCYREETILLPLPGIELRFFGCPARSLVTIPSTQFRLL